VLRRLRDQPDIPSEGHQAIIADELLKGSIGARLGAVVRLAETVTPMAKSLRGDGFALLIAVEHSYRVLDSHAFSQDVAKLR